MIWCVGQDPDVRNIQVYTLQTAGFDARGFDSRETVWSAMQTDIPELLLLDAMLPGTDSMDLLKQIRASSTAKNLPVIMISGKSEYEIVQCLDSGADDCLAKPFGMMELVSRTRALLRRLSAQGTGAHLNMGGICLSLTERTVKVNGSRVNLTYKEFEILRRLLENPGEVFSREQLYEAVWGKPYSDENRTVTIHIRTLRRKLGECGRLIESIRYIGYRMKKVP